MIRASLFSAQAFLVRLIALVATVLAVAIPARPGHAYMSMPVGVASNFLFRDGRVFFAQGTGSLTGIDVETGEVVLRKRPPPGFEYEGTLQQCSPGVVMIHYDRIVLLDPETFDPLWQLEGCLGAAADLRSVVSHDREGTTVRCHDLESGGLRWTATMEGASRIVVAGGKVVVSTHRHFPGSSAFRLFDLESGRELLRKEAPPGVCRLDVHFDGQLIYLTPSPADARDPSPQPTSLVKLSLEGQTLATVAYPSPEILNTLDSGWPGTFLFGDKFFEYAGGVRRAAPGEREAILAMHRQGDLRIDSLPSGVLYQLPVQDAAGASGTRLRMVRQDGSWEAYPCYLGQDGDLVRVGESGGKLLVGSNQGHVECLDLATGWPLWLYAFPMIRRIGSYSWPYGMPPHMARQAAVYRDRVARLGEACGSLALPAGFDPAAARWSDLRDSTAYPGRIVVDPSPDDPFSDLPHYRALLAFLTFVPMVGAVLLVLLARAPVPTSASDSAGPPPRPQPRYAVVGTGLLILSVMPHLGLMLYCRVSYPGTITLKVLFAVIVLGVLYCVVRLFAERRWVVASVLSGAMIAWIDRCKFLWWFA